MKAHKPLAEWVKLSGQVERSLFVVEQGCFFVLETNPVQSVADGTEVNLVFGFAAAGIVAEGGCVEVEGWKTQRGVIIAKSVVAEVQVSVGSGRAAGSEVRSAIN